MLILTTSFKGAVRINVTREKKKCLQAKARHQRLNKTKARSHTKGKVKQKI